MMELSMRRFSVLQRLLFVVVVLMSVYSCSEEKILNENTPAVEEIVKLVADYDASVSIDETTRATEDINKTIYPLEDRNIGLFLMHEDRYNNVPTYNVFEDTYQSFKNLQAIYNPYTYELETSQSLIYPMGNSAKIQAIAYAPRVDGMTFDALDKNGYNFSVQLDQSTVDGMKKSDLIVAKADAPFRSTDPMSITFKHIMAKIKLNLKLAINDPNHCEQIKVSILNPGVSGNLKLAHIDNVSGNIGQEIVIREVTGLELEDKIDDDGNYSDNLYAIVYPFNYKLEDGAYKLRFKVSVSAVIHGDMQEYEGYEMFIPANGGIDVNIQSGKSYTFTYTDTPESPAKGKAPSSNVITTIPDGNYTLQITEEDW